MAYLDLYSEELTRKLKKIKNKNRTLYDIIDKKIAEIIQHPERYKELKHDMKEFRRVHIQKSFVLTFKIDLAKEIVKFEDFDHHDTIYKRRYGFDTGLHQLLMAASTSSAPGCPTPIKIKEIRGTLIEGEILENYPDDLRGPSCLVLGYSGDRAIHVVCGRTKGDWLLVITVYIPRAPKWINERTRAKRGG